MNWTRIRKQLSRRSAIVGAGVAGFVVGAGGLVAAQIDDSPSAEAEVEAEHSADAARPRVAVPGSTIEDARVPTSIDLTIPAVTAASTGGTAPSNTVTDDTIDDHGGNRVGSDDSTSFSVPGNTVTSNTVTSDTAPSNTVDDHSGDRDRNDDSDDSTSSSLPSHTVPSSTVDDHGGDRAGSDDSTSSSVPAALPAPFSRTYQSTGGSIDVTWTGTAFVLNAVSPTPGFAAEVEHQSWDRIRVDFEGGADARIEVRLNDGRLEVRID